jgi:hypothetical protein
MAAFGCGTLLLMVDFSGRVRQWRDDKPGGLAVVDIPEHLVADLGGRRQMRVTGSLNEATFTGSTMLVTGRRPVCRRQHGSVEVGRRHCGRSGPAIDRRCSLITSGTTGQYHLQCGATPAGA